MNIIGLHHATFLTSDLERALLFYRDVLGFRVNPDRPDLGFVGAWLDAGNQQIHLMELLEPGAETSRERSGHGGRDVHIAVLIRELEQMSDQLDGAGIAYTRSKSGRRALFCRDPDGNALELIERVE